MPTRIIAGELAGRRLKTPVGAGVRPTTALVRRALFDILGGWLVGKRVLDLFAGAGTLGLEALSRGAAHATFVERDLRCAKIVQENLGLLRLSERGTVCRAEVSAWLTEHVQDLPGFGLLLLDPPYRDRGLETLLPWLSGRVPWEREVRLVVEHHRRRPVPLQEGILRLQETRGYGDTRLSFFRGVP